MLIAFIFMLLAAASGMFEAAMDAMQFRFSSSVFSRLADRFWNPAVSWKNKWKGGEAGRERFIGSSTVFVFLTDGWHLAKLFRNIALAATVATAVFFGQKGVSTQCLVAVFCVFHAARAFAFHAFFTYVFTKKVG